LKSSIFRRSALEQLSTPEQLDQLLQVTTPKEWLALLSLLLLLVAAILWGFWGRLPIKIDGYGFLIHPGGVDNVVSLVSGQLVEIYVEVGETVQKGQVVARVSEEGRIAGTQIVSSYTGRVLEIKMDEGELVERGTAILSLEPVSQDQDLIVVLYVSPSDGKRVQPGMDVQISPSTVAKEEAGYMLGKVTSVGEFPSTQQGMVRTLGSQELAQAVRAKVQDVAPIEIFVELIPTPNGYTWSFSQGSQVTIQSGTPCTVEIITERKRPIDLVLRPRQG